MHQTNKSDEQNRFLDFFHFVVVILFLSLLPGAFLFCSSPTCVWVIFFKIIWQDKKWEWKTIRFIGKGTNFAFEETRIKLGTDTSAVRWSFHPFRRKIVFDVATSHRCVIENCPICRLWYVLHPTKFYLCFSMIWAFFSFLSFDSQGSVLNFSRMLHGTN